MFHLPKFFILLTVTASLTYAWVGCGVQGPNYAPTLPILKHRVIKGQTAKAHSWPWAVIQEKNGNVFCGGSLLRINDNVEESDIILTAAHCVGFGKTGQTGYAGWTILIGKHDKTQTEEGQEVRNVVQAVTHSAYVPVKNDIAILKLDKPVKFSETIRPPCLPKQGDPSPVGQQCVIAGWGRIDSDDTYKLPSQLQQSVQPVHKGSVCKRNWFNSFVDDTMLCVGVLDGASGACNGDSGGMLSCKDSNGWWIQQGVLSYVGGKGRCLEANLPSVFTKVSFYADWIQSQINDLSSLVAKGK